ncbi:hypothetical protein CBA19CS11_37835 [Caballeronia novacaledonica]|uniref:hypothetical protein n=1 Tax=Caballeronia novacaledonica TaxID=1544861 RepID=UPI001EE1F444|nr:hypothetical protein [Caballeronia novacaledonica]GJH14727.1 hypothetical protein CBA19CS11_37835 [Caballeronia novacaledonica]
MTQPPSDVSAITAIQPYLSLIMTALSVSTLAFILNLLKASRENQEKLTDIANKRADFLKEQAEAERKRAEGERTRLEREVAERKDQMEALLSKSGFDFDAVMGVRTLQTVAKDVREQIEVLDAEIRKHLTDLSNLGLSIDHAREASLRLTLAKGALADNNWEAAAAELDDYSIASGDDWHAHFVRGVAHANSRDGSFTNIAALRAYNDAIALFPKTEDEALKARLLRYRGAMLKRLDRLDESLSDLQLAREKARDGADLLDISYNLSCVYAMKGDKEKMLNQIKALGAWNAGLSMIRSHISDYFAKFEHDPDFLEAISSSTFGSDEVTRLR